MKYLFHTEVEAFMGPKIVRSYYFDNKVKGIAEFWELDIPEDSEHYEEYKGYANAWDVLIEWPSENENASWLEEVGFILVKEEAGYGGEEVNSEIIDMIIEGYNAA